jgi:hypothetical protein
MEGWGAMLFAESPGEISMLMPVVPELRGYHIAAPMPDPTGSKRIFQVWRNMSDPVRLGMTVDELVEWMKGMCSPKTDAEIEANITEWAEATAAYFEVWERQRGERQ